MNTDPKIPDGVYGEKEALRLLREHGYVASPPDKSVVPTSVACANSQSSQNAPNAKGVTWRCMRPTAHGVSWIDTIARREEAHLPAEIWRESPLNRGNEHGSMV